MKTPALILGVPEMDRDHAEIEALIASAGTAGELDLPVLLKKIAEEIGRHFNREESMMAEANVPVMECHKAQHAVILRELAAMLHVAEITDAAAIRKLLTSILPPLIDAHVASVDRLTAEFLKGAMIRRFRHFKAARPRPDGVDAYTALEHLRFQPDPLSLMAVNSPARAETRLAHQEAASPRVLAT